jgi:hypothetical protein
LADDVSRPKSAGNHADAGGFQVVEYFVGFFLIWGAWYIALALLIIMSRMLA